ncbi:MAG: hypothetical protein ABSF99_08235 [Anaerolineales bacterium]
MVEFVKKTNSLFCSLDNEIIEIEPWGRNGLRVRCTQSGEIKRDWINALINPGDYQAELEIHPNGANIRNGEMKAVISSKGEISFINVNDGKELKGIYSISIVVLRPMTMNISTAWGSTNMVD